MLASDRPDQEQAKAGTFDAEDIACRNPVKPVEDTLQVQGCNAQTMIGNREHQPCLAVESQIYLQFRSLRRIFHRVIENVEHRRSQVLRVAENGKLSGARAYGEPNGRILQVVPL